MEKNSTLFSNTSFTSAGKKDLPAGQTELKKTEVPANEAPSDTVISNILNFSKALEVVPLKSAEEKDSIEIVLN